MDEINEQTENMKQIQEALSTPIGTAADFDENELEAELEELEGAELEEHLTDCFHHVEILTLFFSLSGLSSNRKCLLDGNFL
ncbi:vacuolar protein sorting-associated protein 32 homolog 1-like [Magnolia sinica]|uniref:vacuolar protein sorting-associated protein 32 homolog 1-like n=1 Tax=Magnolia sinica TaxID=86752 RepID=UPI00265A1686|nr:vacuolar protein sorting-associated protein 32 homolog 1-like [Magnolia sinica]XP_058088492.1 vacuolar protein sorting-associated protein 32 homolog 1-like [Magnolia sinica]XP_058092206.1 vacuolar protein sorting-associated protein 32 homolog 1-like [Magnolia sinica]XP_058092650.1 vacuolar protein sorting-associated protein 32 homolog 1-like [Magnolia sinica]XP_058106270.1 vacuolar protein sorting-associated protein 32 homolog 1-like [Magnolia sinica]XP_058115099.1 vacuolar protein sorting-